jgi:hypothetical protein
MNGLPATLSDPNAGDNIPELIVVGGTDAGGVNPYIGSNKDAVKGLPHIYAPGTDIQSPKLGSNDGYQPSSGTSVCELNPSASVRIAVQDEANKRHSRCVCGWFGCLLLVHQRPRAL